MGRKQGQSGVAAQPKQDGKQKQKHTQAQAQQKQQNGKSERPAGGMQHYSSFLQVLPLDIDHTCPSVLLFFDKERYLFNAGEGIQRLFREHKLKIKQVSAYLVTRISTETLGGLPGMALSVVPTDGGGLLDRTAACHVKGPRGLAGYVAAFRSYINQENSVAVEEFDESATEPVIKTDIVSITPIIVRVAADPSTRQEGAEPAPAAAVAAKAPSEAAASPAANGHDQVMEERQQPQQPEVEPAADGVHESNSADHGGSLSPAAKRQRTDAGPSAGKGGSAPQGRENGGVEDAEDLERPADLSHPDVVVYAVQLAGRPGKFQPQKARELGVTPGPLFGELQRGRSVTTESGVVVTPADVMEPAVPGPSVLVVDSPSREALEAVAANEKVRRFVSEANASGASSGAAADAGARSCVVVHLAPSAVASDAAAMAAWKEALGPAWRHLVVTSGQQQPSAIPRATVFQAKLHCLSPAAFPLFALDNAAAPPALPEEQLEAAAAAAREAALKEAAAARGGKGGRGGSGGGAAAAAGVAAADGGNLGAVVGGAGVGSGFLPVVAQQPPVLPLPAGSVTQAISAVRLNLMPPARQGLEYSDVFKYDNSSKVVEDMRANPASAEVLAAVAEVQEAAAAAGTADTEAGEDVPAPVASGDRRQLELTFLGTASSQPSKYRNVSGCYVDLFERGGLLVDCGEDAMGQMKRRFGRADAERRLAELGLVWISHMHADHHGGLYRLLEWRARRGAAPLVVVGPNKLFDVLLRYSAVVPIQFAFVCNAALSRPDPVRPTPAPVATALQAALSRLGLAALAPFPVDHIYDAHGLRLEGRTDWVAVFSGDTRPCQETINAARGATLLVHEATFEESMFAEARAKKHSTTAEAVSVGEQAGAYRTILTHFSTRYPTLPELDLTLHPSVAVAMDLMTINLADLRWLPRLVRPMGLLFKQLEAEKLADPDDDE